MNKTSFQRFPLALRSAGFIDPKLTHSQTVLNFAYILFLRISEEDGQKEHEIASLVRRWMVMAILTGRYSASSETRFDSDIRNLSKRGAREYLGEVEAAELSDAFWNMGLVQALETSSLSSPILGLFWAAQVKAQDRGFLSDAVTVQSMIEVSGDVHHLFPRNYLKKHGLGRKTYNQIANLAYTQQEINIAIGAREPAEYFEAVRQQTNGAKPRFGGITDAAELERNLSMHCIPSDVNDLTVTGFEEFLAKRRALMARKLREYYASL
jgi:hypothetical protein